MLLWDIILIELEEGLIKLIRYHNMILMAIKLIAILVQHMLGKY